MDKRDKLFFAIVIICILMLTVLIFYMRSETAYCVKNPFVYGAKRMGSDTQCLCYQYVNPQCPSQFYFNETVLVIKETKCSIGGLTYPLSNDIDSEQ